MPLAQSRPVRSLHPTSREACRGVMPDSISSKNRTLATEGRRPRYGRRPSMSFFIATPDHSGVASTPRTRESRGLQHVRAASLIRSGPEYEMSNGDRNDDHQGDGSGQGRASLLIHADLTSTP